MHDESVIIPDFLPASFEDEFDGARQQVEESHLQRHEAETPTWDDAGSKPRRASARSRGGSRAPWLAGSDLPMVTAAMVVGLIGMASLTGMWGWLAVSRDPLWWGFAVGGAVLFVGLSVLLGVLQHRSRKLVTSERHPEPQAVA